MNIIKLNINKSGRTPNFTIGLCVNLVFIIILSIIFLKSKITCKKKKKPQNDFIIIHNVKCIFYVTHKFYLYDINVVSYKYMDS